MPPIKSQIAAAGLAACALACLIAVPIRADEKDFVIKGWGRVIDPDGDCPITLTEGTLGFKIPGKPHDYAADIQIQNSPRILREVKGDFIAEVRVGGELNPGQASTIAGRPLLSRRRAAARPGQGQLHQPAPGMRLYQSEAGATTPTSNIRKGGEMATSRYEIEIPDQETYLRLERRGGRVYNAASPDGIHWSSYEPIELEMPETVQLGVVGVTSSDVPLAIKFRDMTIFRRSEAE